MNKKRKTLQAVCIIVFAVYFVLLFYFLFFAEAMGRTGGQHETYHYNLILFKEIRRFIEYREVLGTKAVMLNLAGNVVAFMPFGVLVPAIVKRFRKVLSVVLLSLELSLTVEILQLAAKVGSFDVDDLLLNTLGGLAGYICFAVAVSIRRKVYDRNKTQDA